MHDELHDQLHDQLHDDSSPSILTLSRPILRLGMIFFLFFLVKRLTGMRTWERGWQHGVTAKVR